MQKLPPRERRIALDALFQVARACAASWGRRESDRETDRARRMTIGARVKRSFGEECRACALASGRSMYRFVHDALEREIRACKTGTDVLSCEEEVTL